LEAEQLKKGCSTEIGIRARG